MNKRYFVFIKMVFLFSMFIFSEVSYAANCETYVNEKKIYDFMQSSHLIFDGEEMIFPELGINIRWQFFKTVTYQKNCLYVMALAAETDLANPAYHDAYEIVGFNIALKRYEKFDQLVELPNSVIAKIGDHPDFDRKLAYYYAPLTGKSLEDAYKALLTNTHYYGFSGRVVKSGVKADFDPTTHTRKWFVETASFSLRRGKTNEVDDIQSFQFDGLDGSAEDDYWDGCNKVPHQLYKACNVAPWGQAFIHEVIKK